MHEEDGRSVKAIFIGGPLDNRIVDLTHAPPRAECNGITYSRVDDPDTGEFLGGYIAIPDPRYATS